MADLGDGLGDPEWRAMAEWKNGLADVMEGDVQGGLARVGAVARAAARVGWEGTGVTAFREASMVAAAAMDYAAAADFIREGVRYSDSIEQSHCAHVMRGDPGDGVLGRRATARGGGRARQAIVGQGLPARRHDGSAGPSATWPCRAGSSTMRRPSWPTRSRSGRGASETELILPPLWGLAEVALQAGDPKRALRLCRDALARAVAVDERVLLTPFVVTGVRAAQGAGRPAEAASWLEACVAQLDPIRDVAGAALDHGRGLVALAEGSTGIARVALEAAVDGWDGHGRVWEATWARLDLAALPGPHEPVRGGRRHGDRGADRGQSARVAGCSPIGQRRCCGWRAGMPRTTSRGGR